MVVEAWLDAGVEGGSVVLGVEEVVEESCYHLLMLVDALVSLCQYHP